MAEFVTVWDDSSRSWVASNIPAVREDEGCGLGRRPWLRSYSAITRNGNRFSTDVVASSWEETVERGREYLEEQEWKEEANLYLVQFYQATARILRRADAEEFATRYERLAAKLEDAEWYRSSYSDRRLAQDLGYEAQKAFEGQADLFALARKSPPAEGRWEAVAVHVVSAVLSTAAFRQQWDEEICPRVEEILREEFGDLHRDRHHGQWYGTCRASEAATTAAFAIAIREAHERMAKEEDNG